MVTVMARSLVVFLFENRWFIGHSVLCPSEETKPSIISTRLPSFDNVLLLMGISKIFTRFFAFFLNFFFFFQWHWERLNGLTNDDHKLNIIYLISVPGEQGILLGFLNSFVHIFMYFYYMVAAMGPRYRKYLWWKKYMTWIQLIQFTIMLTYLVLLVAFDCKFSRALTFFFVGNVIIFLYLFSRFYVQAYDSKKASAAKTLDQNQNVQISDKHSNIKQDWLFKVSPSVSSRKQKKKQIENF